MVGGENRRVRFGTLALVCIGLFAALFARLWYLQVMNAPAYKQVAEANSTRTLMIPAPRGRILDRNAMVLVDNRPTKVVAIDRQVLDKTSDRDAVLSRLATWLNRYQLPKTPYTLKSIKQTLAINRVGPYDAVPLAQNVNDELLVALTEHAADFPGVVAETRLLRQYHYGASAAQVLGYVGPISEESYKKHKNDADPYPNDAQVGRAGAEMSFEKYLRGKDGKRVVEVTPSGRIVRTVSRTDPVAGDDVELTLDINAQVAVETSLMANIERARASKGNPPVPGAAAMLMQPHTGQVLAMASFPSYDPSIYVPSISEKDLQALSADSANYPLINRVIAGGAAPGSTFKLVTAIAGLRSGIITPTSPFQDNGVIKIDGCTGTRGCMLTNDKGDGALGPLALPKAITKSSNVYFFNIGQKLWQGKSRYGVNALQDTGADLGLGKDTNIDLPGEVTTPLPTQARNLMLGRTNPKAYPNVDKNGNWYSGVNMNVSIGQGDVLVTPLELANAYAQLANGGDRYQPTVLYRVLKPFESEPGQPVDPSAIVVQPEPVKIGHIDLPAPWRDALMAGFSGVTKSGGTAGTQFEGFPQDVFPVAGKTGTAQTGVNSATGKEKFSDSFFVGFGPTPDSKYVGVAMLSEAGYGASFAAPVVRDMLEPVATGGTWPTAQPTIPSTPPPPTPVAATNPSSATSSTNGDATQSGATQADGVTGQPSNTTETTTTGPVATGGN